MKLKANKRKSGEMKEFVCDFPNFDSCNAAKYSVIDSTVASGVLWENQNERKEVASELSLTTRLPQNQFPVLEARRFFLKRGLNITQIKNLKKPLKKTQLSRVGNITNTAVNKL